MLIRILKNLVYKMSPTKKYVKRIYTYNIKYYSTLVKYK